MSLLALGAVLEGKYEYAIVDGNCERDPLAAIRAQIHDGANVLAVTTMPGPQLAHAVPQSRCLKLEFPNLTIVWGGYFPTQHAETILREPYVDFVVRGHGEMVFLDLLNAQEKQTDYRGSAGLAYRDQNGTIMQNPLAPIPHPEHLPPFPFHRVDVQQYIRPTFLGSRTLAYHSSYGCPFFCNFCAVVSMVSGRWLPQSAARVAQVARMYAQRWRVNAIEFYDNNFFTDEARVAEFAERVLPLEIGWWGEARIDTLLKYSDQTWKRMRDGGLKIVFMGAESGSLETLKRMDKGGAMSPDKTLAIADKMQAYDIVPEFSFILGNPPDPEADIHNTIEFIRRVKKVNPRSEIIMYHYTPVPLSGDLYDAAQAQGFHFPKTLDEWVNDAWLRFAQRYSDIMPWMNPALRKRVRNFERVLNAYFPTSTDPRLTGAGRALLRMMSAWRYYLRVYDFPLELHALQKLMHYQRPETSGF
jgi:radical SAM superfamily enzyme YgiQ (UPF0313 family)